MVFVRQGERNARQISRWPRPPRWHRHAGFLLSAAALLSLVGFGVASVLVREPKLSRLDVKVTETFQSFQDARFYRLMFLISSLGYAPVVQVILVAAGGLLWVAGARLESLFTLASSGAAAIVVLTKLLVGRPRPSGKDIRVSAQLPDYGFPSGHTAHYVSFYGFLGYLAATRLRGRLVGRLAGSAAIFLIALVGPSRIYLGQHWLSDVIAAYLLGFAYLVGLTSEYEKIKALKSRSPSR